MLLAVLVMFKKIELITQLKLTNRYETLECLLLFYL